MGDVERVSASAVTALHDIEVEDTVVATLEFTNGAIGTLEAATSIYPGYRRRVELTGTNGTIVLEHDRIITADLRNPVEAVILPAEEDSTPPDIRGHKRLLQDFLWAIETNSNARCDGREGRRSVELVQAIYESSRTSRAVKLTT
jgi:UDP-N-acetyl-2-amino-2-deoxyglucuronate dehydrogenase